MTLPRASLLQERLQDSCTEAKEGLSLCLRRQQNVGNLLNTRNVLFDSEVRSLRFYSICVVVEGGLTVSRFEICCINVRFVKTWSQLN